MGASRASLNTEQMYSASKSSLETITESVETPVPTPPPVSWALYSAEVKINEIMKLNRFLDIVEWVGTKLHILFQFHFVLHTVAFSDKFILN